MRNFYQILDLDRTATREDVKSAFRKKAFQYHPDKNKSENAAEKFIEVTTAYETLYDQQKRAAYDALLNDQYSRVTERPNNSDYSKFSSDAYSHGRQKAQEYSGMSFDEFKNRVFHETKAFARNLPLLVFAIFASFSLIVTMYVVIESGGLKDSPGVAFLMFVLGLGLAIALWSKFLSSYGEDRKQ